MIRLNRAASVGLIAMVATAGCKGTDFFGPGPDESLPENHPPATGPAALSVLAWSQNGHLAYVLPDLTTAVAREGGTGPVRILYTVSAPAQVGAVALSPDASQWYTVTHESGASVLRWHHDGTSEVLTDHGITGYIGQKREHGVIVAANGDVAFIARPDSLFLKQGDAPPRFVAVGCRTIAAISPTGDRVICHHPDPFSNPLLFAVDGSATTVAASESNVLVKDVRWTAQGIHLLYSVAASRLVYERQTDPQSKFSTAAVEYPEMFGFQSVLAPDGRSFAYTTDYCAKSSGLFGCDKRQVIVYHADPVARTTKRVAVQNVFYERNLSMSPDGRRIAYTLDGHLWVISVD